MAMYYARILTTHSYSVIGKYMGGKEHATVMYAVKTIKALSIYKKTRDDLDHLNRVFGLNGHVKMKGDKL